MFRYAAVSVLMLSSAAAMADGPSYSYIQASYVDIDVDVGGGASANGNGFGVAGSVELNDNWHIFADYMSADLESVLNIDITTIGGGYRHAISDTTDVFAELGYAKLDVQFAGDESGLSAKVGIRSMVNDSLEVYGTVGTLDLDNVDWGTEFGAGVWYTVSGNLAVGADARFASDVTRLGIGVRLYFDK